jgi:nitroreductase
MIEELVLRNRSCRRFHEGRPVAADTLRWLVNLARLSASGANLQPLKYVISSRPQTNETIFPCLGWAGYLKEWPGPAPGERPAAYILVLGDTEIARDFGCDHGIAAQSILLGAREIGIAGCMIGSVNRKRLSKALRLPEALQVLLVIALGEPKETVVCDPVGEDGSIRYWRDEKEVHHVPKRSLDTIIVQVHE